MVGESSSGALPPTLAVVVLAAGGSSRFGGFPKALVRLGGETAIERVLRLAEGLRPSRIVVVVGPHRVPIRAALAGRSADVVENPDWEKGRTGSVQAGLAAIPEPSDVLIWPVDHPLVEDMTLRALVAAAREDQMAVWFVPSHDGHGGHPVLVRAAVRGKIGTLPPDAPLRSLLPALALGVRHVTVHDPGVLVNIDSPESLERALDERGGQEVR